MTTRTLFLLGAFAASVLTAVACGSDDESNAPTNFTTSASSTSSTATGTGGGGGEGTGGDATTSTTSTTTGGGGAGGGVNCDGPNGCYNCPPVTDDQHLNACTDAQCTPFDNVARLPLYNGGNLPPVP